MAGLGKRWLGRALCGLAGGLARTGLIGPRQRGGPVQLPAGARVLLLVLDRLGDGVMALPLLTLLRRQVPGVEITVLAGPGTAPLFGWAEGKADRVWTHRSPWWGERPLAEALVPSWWAALPSLVRRLRRERFDLVLDLRGDPRNLVLGAAARPGVLLGQVEWGGDGLVSRRPALASWYHQVDRKLALLAACGLEPWAAGGPRADDPPAGWGARPRCTPPAPALAAARRELLPAGGGPGPVLVDPGGKGVQRWPESRWSRVLPGLAAAAGGPVLVSAGPEATAPAKRICAGLGEETARLLPPAGGIAELAARLAVGRLLVSADTGAAHLAAAVGTATVTIYGPTQEERFWCGLPGSRVVRGAPCCLPGVLHRRCRQAGTGPERPGACMAAVTPAMVRAAVAAVLEEEG